MQESRARPSAAARILDCARLETSLFWFLAGAVLALAVMGGYGSNDWPSLLRVGSQNPLLDRIESELGPISSPDPIGHDGQLYYLIARDPLGVLGTPEAIATFDNNGPHYRYRRILYPLLAGGFGLIGGQATLVGMILWLAVGIGIATVATADICCRLHLPAGTVFAAAVNAGAFASLLFLTADALGMGLALAGIALRLRSRFSAALILFALAGLTKEVYLIIPMAIAAWTWTRHCRRQAATMAIVPAVPIIVWSVWLLSSMPPAETTVGNIGAPLVGIWEAVPMWIRYERNRVELVLAAFSTLTCVLAVGAVAIGRNGLLRWVIAFWCGLACVASVVVWGKPNNIARTVAILWPLSVLLACERRSRPGRRASATHSSGISGSTRAADRGPVITAEERPSPR